MKQKTKPQYEKQIEIDSHRFWSQKIINPPYKLIERNDYLKREIFNKLNDEEYYYKMPEKVEEIKEKKLSKEELKKKKKIELHQKELEERRIYLEKVRNQVKRIVEIPKSMKSTNNKFLNENADFLIKMHDETNNCELNIRGPKHIIEIEKPKIFKPVIFLNPEKNLNFIREKSSTDEYEQQKYKYLQRSVDNEIKKVTDPHFYSNKFGKLKSNFDKKNNFNSKSTIRAKTAKGISSQVSKVLKTKSTKLLHDDRNDKTNNELLIEKISNCIKSFENVINCDLVKNFILNGKEVQEIKDPKNFENNIFHHTNITEYKMVKLEKEILDKQISNFFPNLKKTFEMISDIK